MGRSPRAYAGRGRAAGEHRQAANRVVGGSRATAGLPPTAARSWAAPLRRRPARAGAQLGSHCKGEGQRRHSTLNVTVEEFEAYIRAFHECLETSAATYLQAEVRPKLLHLSLLPASITGYISTQFGVAIEYLKAAETSIQVIRGSARVEELLIPAPRRFLGKGAAIGVAAPRLSLIGPRIEGGFPFRLLNLRASATLRDATFVLGDYTRYLQFAEVVADRAATNWSIGKAESRAKDEVLAALVHVQHAHERELPIGEYVKQFKDKTVLLLGSYEADGIARLEALAVALRERGYDPILIKNVPDHPHQDLTQKVVAIAAIARFIIVDDSTKSGHLAEVQLCKLNNWITVLLRAHGVGASWMTAGASIASNVIHELPYDPTAADRAIELAAGWAEDKIRELEVRFDSTYPWRQSG